MFTAKTVLPLAAVVLGGFTAASNAAVVVVKLTEPVVNEAQTKATPALVAPVPPPPRRVPVIPPSRR